MGGYRIVLRETGWRGCKVEKDYYWSCFLIFSLLINLKTLPSSIFFPSDLRYPFILSLLSKSLLCLARWVTEDPPCCTCAVPGVQWQQSESTSQIIFVPISYNWRALPIPWSQGHFSSLTPDPIQLLAAAAKNTLRKRFFGTGYHL